jgi:uncharacterized protein with PQ loop repeat
MRHDTLAQKTNQHVNTHQRDHTDPTLLFLPFHLLLTLSLSVPPSLQLLRTKSARDLSYSFLYMYVIGLLFMTIYLYVADAFVAAICVTIQVSLSFVIVFVKFYLDNFGPNKVANDRTAKPNSKLTNSKSFAHDAKADVQTLLTGGAAPFQIVPSPHHRAEHLLIDCKVKTTTATAAADVLTEVSKLMEVALASANIPVKSRKFDAFPSFKSSSTSVGNGEAEEHGRRDHFFFSCRDGYTMGLWYAEGGVLSVDMLAAEEDAVEMMTVAAKEFCDSLTAGYPGTKISASVMKRLPTKHKG